MISTLFSTLGTNILSDIIYDIGKHYINNNKGPLTEQDLIDIISGFQSKLDSIFPMAEHIEDKLQYIQIQNETILKLLLKIYDNNRQIQISYMDNGYRLEGEYTLSSLNEKAKLCIQDYIGVFPEKIPATLNDAIWPISNDIKEQLLDELEQVIQRGE